MCLDRFARLIVMVFVFVCCIRSAATLWAQTATGRIVGTVTDPTGAVIPGATITATNVDTLVTYTAITNEQGAYQVPLLPIGTYTVTGEQPGFQKGVTKPEKLEINQSLRVDIKMVVGGRTEEVVVEEGISHVETITPTLGMSVTANQIQSMPLNGRNTLELALLQPGVIPSTAGGTTTATCGGGSTCFSVAGGRQDSVTYLLDGGINNNLLNNGVVLNPNPDMVEEFRILTSTYNAEYGRNAGGIVSVVTKSGANNFHGTAYDYERNDALNANAFFNKANGLPKDILERHQFGGTVGGPILKDKFFFYSGWQTQRLSQLRTTNKVQIFTPAELNGDFSLSNAAHNGPDANVAGFLQKFPYFQPSPALAAQGIIDLSRISSIAKNYIKNSLIPADPSGFKTFQDSARDNINELTNKVDYYLTPKDRISATFGYSTRTQLNPFTVSTSNNWVAGFPNQTQTKPYYLALNYVRTFSPSLLNDFRLTGQRNNTFQAVPTKKLPTAADLGIGITSDDPTGPPILRFATSDTYMGFSNQGPTRLIDNTFTWNDTLTWIKGAHTFKAGGTFTPYQNNTVYDFYINGQFYFDANGVVGGYTKNDRADFILGLADEFLQYPAAPSNIRSKNVSGFLQDEWKVRRNFTLSLGVRYEYSSPKKDLQGRSFTWALGQQSTVFPNAPRGILFPGDANAPTGANFPDRNDWAPRFGFAWSPGTSGKTSIRGGFGVFYDILKAEDNLQFNGQAPFFGFADLQSFKPVTTNPVSEPLTMSQPFVAAGQPNPFPSVPPAKNLNFAAAGFLPLGGGGVYSVDANLRTPYVYQYNLDIQREITSNTILDVAYAGSDSHKLTGLYDSNPFIPGTTSRIFNTPSGNPANAFNYLDTFANVGMANYNSLQLGLRGRPRDVRAIGTVSYQFSWTYSKSEDNTSGFRSPAPHNRVPYFNHNQFKSVSSFDLPHYVALSGTWELPFAKIWGKGPSRLTKGWTIQPIVNHRSGEPLDVDARLTRSRTNPGPSGAGDGNLVRANLVAPISYFDAHLSQTIGGKKGNYFFDPSSFSRAALLLTPAQGFDPVNNPSQRTYGTFGRNAFRGPTRTNVDVSIAKITNLDEQRKLEFRAEMFNMPNLVLFRNPNTALTSGTFGQISATGSATDSQPRVIQLALKLYF